MTPPCATTCSSSVRTGQKYRIMMMLTACGGTGGLHVVFLTTRMWVEMVRPGGSSVKLYCRLVHSFRRTSASAAGLRGGAATTRSRATSRRPGYRLSQCMSSKDHSRQTFGCSTALDKFSCQVVLQQSSCERLLDGAMVQLRFRLGSLE